MERSVLASALVLTSTCFISYLNLSLSFSRYDVAGQFQECVFVG